MPPVVRQCGTAHRRLHLNDLLPLPSSYYGSLPLANLKPGQRNILEPERQVAVLLFQQQLEDSGNNGHHNKNDQTGEGGGVEGSSSSSKPAKTKPGGKDFLVPRRSSQKKKISWLNQPLHPSSATSTRAHHKLRPRLIPVSE